MEIKDKDIGKQFITKNLFSKNLISKNDGKLAAYSNSYYFKNNKLKEDLDLAISKLFKNEVNTVIQHYYNN